MLSDEELAARAARKAQRVEAARRVREQRELQGILTPDQLAVDRQTRQALRGAEPAPMTGWFTPTGGDLPSEAGVMLPLTPGWVATRSPAAGGIITPEQAVVPGLPYVVAAEASGSRSYVGLQWVNKDGTSNPAILWAAGPGRVTVSGVAPDTAGGVRILLACYSTANPDLAGKDTPTRVIQQNLKAFIVSTGGTP